MPRARSRDVADAAGVSQTTVSLVMNGREARISADTRTLVEETARRLGYIPSARGRNLRAGTSNIVACVVPDLPVSEALERLKRELSRVLEEAGFCCVFLHPNPRAGVLAAIRNHLEPAAVIALDRLAPADMAMLRASDIPLVDAVLVPRHPDDDGLDQARIGAMQIEFLVSKGHRAIWYAPSDDRRDALVSAPREAGARHAARTAGISLVVQPASLDPRQASRQWDRIRREDRTPTAVAAYNDVSAFAILGLCARESISVPDQLAVIGVDDIVVAGLSVPALSTIALDLSRPAFAAAIEVIHLIGGDPPPRMSGPQAVLTLIERDTT